MSGVGWGPHFCIRTCREQEAGQPAGRRQDSRLPHHAMAACCPGGAMCAFVVADWVRTFFCCAGTVGLYKEPVAILDFASLYPSIYR